jgi:type IV fimbrial biogenesis protein FimT
MLICKIRRPDKTRGFTLMELMFTLLIASILLGVGIPAFRGMTATSRITTQSNDFVAAITFARSEAIRTNANVTLCRVSDESDTTCNAGLADWGAWALRNAAGNVIRRGVVNTYGGAVVVSSNLTLDRIVFSSDGLARTGGVLVSNRSFTICTNYSATDNIRRVDIGAGSRVSTVKNSGACP